MFEMQKFSLPPIGTGIHVTVAAKKPPARNWSKYKKVLIDNPKDSNLLQRQKLWNFQKLNRGAFRSQLTSLPDIPYRAHGHPAEKVDVGVQADLTSRFSQTLRVIFPNLANKVGFRSKEKNSNVADDGEEKEVDDDEAPKNDGTNVRDELDEISDPGLDYESVVRRKNVGTMTMLQDSFKSSEQKRVTPREKKVETLPILKSNKNVYITQTPLNKKKSVKFKPDKEKADSKSESETTEQAKTEDVNVKYNELDLPKDESEEEIVAVLPKVHVEITELPEKVSSPSPSSESSGIEIPVGNVGHSSTSRSDSVNILDFISGNVTDRSRHSDYPSSRRAKFITDPEADRVWFEKLVGDKEVIDSGSYDNFARLPQNIEIPSDVSNTEKIDITKSSQRKNFTPKINDEFSVYHSVLGKASNTQNNNINKGSKNTKRGVIYVGKSY